MHRLCLLLLPMAVLTLGCYETKQHYILNPDGSGKVQIEARFTSLAGGEPGKAAKETAKSILKDTKGVEAWSDVAFGLLDDGKISFSGTAYFKDVRQFECTNLGDIRVSLTPVEEGSLMLRVYQVPHPRGQARQSTVQEQRSRYQQAKGTLGPGTMAMKTDLSFQLPGTVMRSVNLTPTGNEYGLHIDGSAVLAAMDALLQNDDWLLQRIDQKLDILDDLPSGDELNERLFGTRGPIEARLAGPFPDQFNYLMEVEKAKNNYESMLERVGLGDLIPPKMATGGGFRSLRVAKVALSNMDDPDYLTFGSDQSYQLSLLGELPGAVLNVKEGTLERAVADNGDDLAPEGDYSRGISAQLSNAKTHVMMDVRLRVPGPSVHGIREIAGTLQYEVSQKTRVFRSPLIDLIQGAQLGFLNASVSKIEPNKWDTFGHGVTLKLESAADLIKVIRILDASGATVETAAFSAGDIGDGKCDAYFNMTKPLPKKGYVEVETHDDVQRFVIPFHVENLDLLGNLTQ